MTDNTSAATAQRVLTFGEKAAGIGFNPGKDPEIDVLKQSIAGLIDFCNNKRNDPACTQQAKRYYSTAITYLEIGQMEAVKAMTWQHPD